MPTPNGMHAPHSLRRSPRFASPANFLKQDHNKFTFDDLDFPAEMEATSLDFVSFFFFSIRRISQKINIDLFFIFITINRRFQVKMVSLYVALHVFARMYPLLFLMLPIIPLVIIQIHPHTSDLFLQ
jgi:hypothetical protein